MCPMAYAMGYDLAPYGLVTGWSFSLRKSASENLAETADRKATALIIIVNVR
jgi:hypothetical protein